MREHGGEVSDQVATDGGGEDGNELGAGAEQLGAGVLGALLTGITAVEAARVSRLRGAAERAGDGDARTTTRAVAAQARVSGAQLVVHTPV